ncbi:MAG TPA: hypothetical protein VHZ74_02480 [Bryobacteraceae bacterium]|nr:hypothetical protein [Bryobacteraceae bacterium]
MFLLGLYCALSGLAQQYSESQRVLVPATGIDADITLVLRASFPSAPAIDSLRMVAADGRALSPQPLIGAPEVVGNQMKVHLSGLYFWGEARLLFTIAGNPPANYTYSIQRGPDLTDPSVSKGSPGQIWLYNFDTQPLTFRWRLASGTEFVCGVEVNGQPRRECDTPDRWSQMTIGPASSEAILFQVPDWWFDRLGKVDRQALLELRVPTGNRAAQPPALRRLLTLHLTPTAADRLGFFIPPVVQHILWITPWVTLGAMFLMIAQVLIPNFRKCLTMENKIEALQERLRAISSDIGSRLYTRCQQEMDSFTSGLAMRTSASKAGWLGLSLKRLALSGNTAEVNRLLSILPRINTRIALTERLDERQTAALDSGSRDLPPSLYWDRAKQIGNVQTILARQFITDADEKSASASLDLLGDAAASMNDFAAELEARIASLRRQFAGEPLKGKHAALTQGMNGCAELLNNTAAPPDGGWTTDELVIRDLAAVRLAAVSKMIRIDCLMLANPDAQKEILKKLGSDDPAKLEEADVTIAMVAQSVSEGHVTAALASEMWDVYAEPATITDQDVLRVAFTFRDPNIDQSAAKSRFQCWWRIRSDDPGSKGSSRWFGSGKEAPRDANNSSDDDIYESGWHAQFIPAPGKITITPMLYDHDGKELTIRKENNKEKGVVPLTVGPPPGNNKRFVRGVIDAAITAVVPVVTVALTQNGADLTFDKLVLLGFTSQAIRAAVVPEAAVDAAPAPASTSVGALAGPASSPTIPPAGASPIAPPSTPPVPPAPVAAPPAHAGAKENAQGESPAPVPAEASPALGPTTPPG